MNVTKLPVRRVPITASEDEARAKFEYFRKTEATINAGPEPYEPAPIRKNKPTAECGTHSGYKNHIIKHETPCRSCMDARAKYQREYRARKKTA